MEFREFGQFSDTVFGGVESLLGLDLINRRKAEHSI